MSDPLFSLAHITCRVPDGWQNAARIWKLKADHPENVEYVLGIHERQQELPFADKELGFQFIHDCARYDLEKIWPDQWRIAINHNRHCIVDNANSAVAATRGKILIGISDDLRPCEHWDTQILEALEMFRTPPQFVEAYMGQTKPPARAYFQEAVLKVSHGFPAWEAKYPRIITHGIVTRAYYERIGYAAWPEYLDYGCDDDFSEQAYKNGVVIERPDIVFPHLSWMNGKRKRDACDEFTGRKEVWDLKEKILTRRRAEGFPEGWPEGFPKP